MYIPDKLIHSSKKVKARWRVPSDKDDKRLHVGLNFYWKVTHTNEDEDRLVAGGLVKSFEISYRKVSGCSQNKRVI